MAAERSQLGSGEKPAANETEFDLNTCDLEPIHTPGRIQPFGALLAGPLDLSCVAYCSANVIELLGQSTATVLDSEFETLLGREAVHDLRGVLSASTSRTQRVRVGSYTLADRAVELFAHVNPDGLAIVELEPKSAPTEHPDQSPMDLIRNYLELVSRQETIVELLKGCVKVLRELTNYDRVMAYRFHQNDDGEVIAEARCPGVDSFLGLRYPAWDVPAQARALQVRCPLRMLTDIKQQPVTILAADASAPALDVGLAHLRGISPIHVEYLGNMGVGATMSIGLIVGGKLWGLFACHHSEPRVISSDQRIAVELFGQIISLLIKEKLDLQSVSSRRRAAEARQRVVAETVNDMDLLDAFPAIAPILAKVIDCDGAALVRNQRVLLHGNTPGAKAVLAISTFEDGNDDLIAPTHQLGVSGWAGDHDINGSSGALLVRATAIFPIQLIFFRDEVLRSITWAGKPQKSMDHGPMGPRITPRGSFEAYLEQQRGCSEEWAASDLDAAQELQVMLTQITARGERLQLMHHLKRVDQERQQNLMIAELNHRVKNILALIRSLSRQVKSSSTSLESYALALEERIAALAAAHDLAVSNTMKGVSLRSIVTTEFDPYMSDENMQILISGPVVGLRADVAPMLALVIHEVVSNAAKYGALSVKEGVVKVQWAKERDGLHFSWKEFGGPVVQPPSRHGFGRSLIEKAIPHELGGTASLLFNAEGVRFTFALPADSLVDIEDETQLHKAGKTPTIDQVAEGKQALLMEDNVILAMDMDATLVRLGATRVYTASTTEEAMQAMDEQPCDFAILDINLRGIVTFEAAHKLKKRGTPFIFVTGYGSHVDIPEALRDVPILTKPIDEGTLSEQLALLLNQKAS